MGVKIFRDDNWSRIKSGVIFRKDVMGLDPDGDRELIGYLIAHSTEASRLSMIKYASEKYGMDEMPEPRVNTDDPEDASFWEYAVLLEQVGREDDSEALKAAALHSSDRALAAFAFCRLTGCSLPPDECDAYSYRTFSCGILRGATAESVAGICRSMIEEGGPLQDVAEECLRRQKTDDP